MIQVRKVSELVVPIKHRPGEIARVLGAIAVAGMNVEGYMAHARNGEEGVLRVLVEDPGEARRRLESENCAVAVQEVLAVINRNAIGSEAGIARRLSAAGVNILHAYATATGDGAYLSVIATSDNDAAMRALSA